jgi:N-methylhydantoinase A
MQYRVAVDVGGTFMDFVLLDENSGAVRVEKILSIPDELPSQFLKGLTAFGATLDSIHRIFHGMTVGVNALIQEKGAKVGLITTKGFRDVLEIGRGGRKPVYDFVHKNPVPLVERHLRREVTERVSFVGEILQPIDLEELDREVDFLRAEGIEAIAICFLHSYAQSAHEIAARERIRTRHPGLPVSASHEIASEWREYERTSTTVLNAFIQPVVQGYLNDLQDRLKAAGHKHPLAVMQSSGGVVDARTAGEKPIRTLMSGPAGGVIGAKFLCDRLGYRNVICTDVGGTTYDVAIIEDARVLERSQMEIAQRPILGSLIDVTSIGAGGGSIAWLDHRNGLQVGPRSAGASPGPACFGKNGTEPTVTDAHLVLGRLDPEYFLGGRMKLDPEAARRAIKARIADPLDLNILSAAQGIVAIAETNMANAIRTKTVERGLDPREFVLLAYGGGGGLFACPVAEELGVQRVIIPNAPANFSAWGILTTDYMEDEVRTHVMPCDAASIGRALDTLAELKQRAVQAIEAYGFDRSEIETLRRFDLRFKSQEYTITVNLERSWSGSDAILAGARKAFVDSHRRLYGHGDPDADLELVSVRCRAIGRVRAPKIAAKNRSRAEALARTRKVFFPQARGELVTSIFMRDSLNAGELVQGPAVVDEWTMTTVVPPGWQAGCDDHGNLVLEPTTPTASQERAED